MSDSILQQEYKLKSTRTLLKFEESPNNMQSDDFFARKFKALNDNMGSSSLNASGKADCSGQNNGTPAMPKMGVRARVSEWPPKKDCSKEMCSKLAWEARSQSSYETVVSVNSNGQDNQSDMVTEKSFDLAFADTKYSIGDIFCHSPYRGLHPIRQRSNSDVTISDIDAEDVLDQNAVNPNTGAALHREYGSTSSIDRQGLSGENFFAMLRGYRVENVEHKNLEPFTFSEVFHCDPTVSPSLHAATQISRGEFSRISGFDYMDSGMLVGKDRDKLFKNRLKTEAVETSLFRKLRTVKSEHDALKFSFDLDDGRFERSIPLWSCQKCFAHYDVQSILFNINEAMVTCTNVAKRKNLTTGASAASQSTVSGGQTGSCDSPLGSKEDLNTKDNCETDDGDGKSNNLVLSCRYFRNEIGGEEDRRIALSRANSSSVQAGESCSFESSLSSHCTNAGVSVLEVPRENQPIHREKVKRYIIEHIDLGAYYYRKYFYGKEHQNYFGIDDNLGPVAVSIRREKVDDVREKEGSQFNYRVTFRTSELTTLRGAILEEAVPSTARHGTARGLPHKEVMEYVIPELNIQCMRQALNSPKVPEQLLKLDEQGLSFQHKVGILYCKAGESSEEEMYNNETAGHAFEEFLDLLGHRVRLKGFNKYRAQLDNKTDSTGTHSLYTTYKDYELMFHVSTMLPYMPSNRQQHTVAVSRSKDVPPFGPPIPKGVTFPKSAVFRDFLLAKVINAENAAHKSEKFRAMATRTRQEYLKDLAENFVTTATVDSSVKFSFITLGAKRKEKVKPKRDAHLYSVGAIVWNVLAQDFGLSTDIECLLGISNECVILVEKESKNVVFNCSCRDVIGWTSGLMTIKMFYERGECVLLSSMDNCAEDVRDIVQRLVIVTRGCETTEITLRRNGLGQLGFHVNFEGIVADVEPFGFAWKAGLRQGSRLVEICKVAVATLSHEQMIDLLRTSMTVKVVIIQPHDDGSPRRHSWSRIAMATRHQMMPREAKWHVSSTKISSSYKERGLQKKSSDKISPNKHSHIADKSCSSHSSSNTLSSNASSNSDEKHFGSEDPMDPELLGLTYIKGASTDSGIDTAPCSLSAQIMTPVHLSGSRSMSHSRTEQMVQWNNSSEGTGPDNLHSNMYAVHGYPVSHATDGSIGDLSELSSHSSGSHHSGSPSAHCPKNNGTLDTSKVHIVSHASGQQTAGFVSKTFHRQGAVSKYVIGWKKSEDDPPPEECDIAECQGLYSEVAMSASSQLQYSLMDTETERQNVLSKDDCLKMMLPNSPNTEEGRGKFSIFGSQSLRRSLYRTLSDESMCSNRRGSSYASSRSSILDQALPNDILFSTTPPYHSTLPSQTHLTPGMGSLRSECWFSDGSLSDKSKFNDPGLMPLPDAATGLDWSHLVNAARAFEDQRVASFCTLNDMQQRQGSQELTLCSGSANEKDFSNPTGQSTPSTLTGKVNQLEVILRQLQTDLLQEKEDKAILQAEVHHLREHNIRLQEESQTASAQLRKFTEWFFNSVDKKS
ncbi:hypothetical protein FKM82_010693 [Ascaphus truei]